MASYMHDIGRLFYIVSPLETVFHNVTEVPDYISTSGHLFFVGIILEIVVLLITGGPRKFRQAYHRHDSIASVTAGLVSQLIQVIIKGVSLEVYVWVFNRINIWTFAHDSVALFFVSFLSVDLAYYFYHRAAHEIHFLWAQHVVHHSSEFYNLTTALRQSILQAYFSWIFSLPFAFVMTPVQWVCHRQFNALFQFWIHTQVITKLPWPIEFIFNTPSHHRVHHGRNRYCIDKNYGGTLIIWFFFFMYIYLKCVMYISKYLILDQCDAIESW